MSRKFYKNVVTITVLTEEPIEDGTDLDAIHEEISVGGWVGSSVGIVTTELSGKECADALYAVGSEPGFFQLDDNGRSEDEDC